MWLKPSQSMSDRKRPCSYSPTEKHSKRREGPSHDEEALESEERQVDLGVRSGPEVTLPRRPAPPPPQARSAQQVVIASTRAVGEGRLGRQRDVIPRTPVSTFEDHRPFLTVEEARDYLRTDASRVNLQMQTEEGMQQRDRVVLNRFVVIQRYCQNPSLPSYDSLVSAVRSWEAEDAIYAARLERSGSLY